MAEPYHNILSKASRALVAYLVARGVSGIDADTVVPLKRAQNKELPIVICAATSANRSAEDPGYYEVTASVIVRTVAAIDLPQDDVDGPVDASEELQGNVFDAFKLYNTDGNTDSGLADQITSDARAAAAAAVTAGRTYNQDLADFTCLRVIDMGQAVESDEKGTFWDDSLTLKLICTPSNVS